MAFSAGEIEAVLKLRDEMSAKLREASGVLAKFGDDARGTTAKLAAFGTQATSAGMALSVGLTAPLVAASGASLYFSGQFESTMVKLHTLAGVSSDDLAKVKNHILDLAPAVGIGPQALALAMTKVSSTVSDTNVALEILDISARGSAAGLGEAVDVAGALTAIINSYGAQNITAARAGDILTQAIKDGGAEAKELAPTLANVVPFAAAMGISFEEVAANIATMTKLGTPATEAVTSLTAVMVAMNKPSNEAQDALGRVGLTFADLRKEITDKGLAASLIDLKGRFAGNTEELITIFGRIEAFKNILGTAGSQADTYTQVLANMADSSKDAGVLQEAFNEITKTQQQSIASLAAQVQVIAIKFGDALAPSLAKVIEMAQPLLEKILGLAEGFNKLDPTTQKIIIGAVGLVAAIGPVLLILGQLASGLAAVIEIAPAVGAAVTVMTGPFGLFALAAVAAIAVIVKFKSNVKSLEDSSKGAANEIKLIDPAAQALAEKLKAASEEANKFGVATSGMTVTISDATRAQYLFGDSSVASIAQLKPLAEATKHAAVMADKQKEAAEKVKVALVELNTYSLNYADTLATVSSADQTMIGTLLQHGATVAQIAAAYPRLSTAQIASVDKSMDAEKKRVDALAKAEEEIAKLHQDAAAAISALDDDTLANRLKHLNETQAADITAALTSIDTAEQQAQAIFEIESKYSALGLAEQRKDADEKNTILADGAIVYLSIVKANADAAFNLSSTDRDKSLRAIQQNEQVQLEAVRRASGETAAFKAETETAIRAGSAASVAALSIDNAALTASSQKHFDQVALTAKNTYEDAKKRPKEFSAEAIAAFKDIADAAAAKSGDVKAIFHSAFTNIGSGITAILINSFTNGGGIVGAAKATATLAGAEIGKSIGKMTASLGSMAGPIGSIVGSLAGPLIDGVFKLFGSVEKQVNKTRDGFVAAAGGISELDAKAHAAGLTLDKFLNAKNPTAYKAAVDELNAAFAVQKDLIAAANSQFGPGRDELVKLSDKAKAVYEYMSKSGQFTADQLAAAFKASNDAQAASLGINTAAQKKHYDEMKSQLESLMSTRETLFKTIEQEAPEEVMGVIESATRAQLAVLDNEISNNRQKLKDEADAAAKVLEDALSAIKPNAVHQEIIFDIPPYPPNDGEGAARGGLVTASGIQFLARGGTVRGYARGTDTVPAMLTPGEAVLTTGAVRSLGTSAISSLNAGGSLGNDEVINELRMLRKQQAASDRALPLLVSLSVRDAMQLQR